MSDGSTGSMEMDDGMAALIGAMHLPLVLAWQFWAGWTAALESVHAHVAGHDPNRQLTIPTPIEREGCPGLFA